MGYKGESRMDCATYTLEPEETKNELATEEILARLAEAEAFDNDIMGWLKEAEQLELRQGPDSDESFFRHGL